MFIFCTDKTSIEELTLFLIRTINLRTPDRHYFIVNFHNVPYKIIHEFYYFIETKKEEDTCNYLYLLYIDQENKISLLYNNYP